LATIRVSKSLSWTFGPENRWSLQGFLLPTWTLFSQTASSNSLYFMPSLSYRVSDPVTWTLFMETFYTRSSGASFLDWSSGSTPSLAIGPSVTYKSGFNIQPFLSIYPGGRINWDTTQLGVYFGGRLF
jgi:hypothetical protein